MKFSLYFVFMHQVATSCQSFCFFIPKALISKVFLGAKLYNFILRRQGSVFEKHFLYSVFIFVRFTIVQNLIFKTFRYSFILVIIGSKIKRGGQWIFEKFLIFCQVYIAKHPSCKFSSLCSNRFQNLISGLKNIFLELLFQNLKSDLETFNWMFYNITFMLNFLVLLPVILCIRSLHISLIFIYNFYFYT